MFNNDFQKVLSSINGDTFVYADTHFFHDNVLSFEPIRLEAMKKDGFSDMNEWLIYKWNSVVGENDTVLFLGDFAFKNIPALKGRLNGTLIFILGNHDRKGPNVYKDIFHYILNGAYMLMGNKLYVAQSSDELFSTLFLEYNGKKLVFSHYPATETEKKWYPIKSDKLSESKLVRNKIMSNRIDEVINVCKEMKAEYNLHGHKHTRAFVDNEASWNFVNCSLEAIDFKPIKLKNLLGF